MRKLKDIEDGFREDLMHFLYNSPLTPNRIGELDFQGMALPPSSRRYQSELANKSRGYRIVYKGMVFGEIYKVPHKRVILFEYFDHFRLFAKTFEKVVRTYAPEAKVEFRYGE